MQMTPGVKGAKERKKNAPDAGPSTGECPGERGRDSGAGGWPTALTGPEAFCGNSSVEGVVTPADNPSKCYDNRQPCPV